MSYFSFIRSTDYSFKTKDPREIVSFDRVKDITQRFKLVEYIRSSKVKNSQYYFIQDGERPDIVSYKIYGKADLHWLLFLFNDIINPLFEWPVSYSEIQKIINDKYEGSSLFLNIFAPPTFDESSADIECRAGKDLFFYEQYNIQKNDELVLINQSLEISGKILDFDLSTGEMRVLFGSNNFDVISPNSNRINPDSYSQILLTTKNPFGEEVTVDIKNSVFSLFKNTRFVVDHFENEEGLFLSPLFYFEDANSGNFGGWNSDIDNITQGIPPINASCFSSTLLGKYLLESNEKFAISKEFKEFSENETRRKIEFPDPIYVPEILKQIRKIISE